MLNTIKISAVFDRKHVATKPTAKCPHPGLIQLSVTVNGERKFLSTGVSVYQGQFYGGHVINRLDAPELDKLITNHIRAIIEVINQCNSTGRVFSWFLLESLRIRRGSGDTSWTDWMERTIHTRRLADGTRTHQLTVLQFLKSQKVTDFAQLTPDTIARLDDTLRSRTIGGRPMLQTSIYGYHKVIKAYIHLAIRAGLMEHDPYAHFKTEKGESRPREVLTMEEIRRLEALHLTSLYMQHVRDLFLLQVWTGLSYSDLMTADFSHAQGDTLSGFRCKTGISYTTVLLPQAKAILERYHYRIPVMAYDNYRRMLQPMCDMAGIDKHISTHNGRHTFATTVTLGHGVPIEMVSRMLGHKSIKTTQIYARVQRSMIQEQADRLSKLAL
jgi:site-specific recombinase XerD